MAVLPWQSIPVWVWLFISNLLVLAAGFMLGYLWMARTVRSDMVDYGITVAQLEAYEEYCEEEGIEIPESRIQWKVDEMGVEVFDQEPGWTIRAEERWEDEPTDE